jgi:hypothetical protein
MNQSPDMSPIDAAVMSTVNAPLRNAVKADELVLWLVDARSVRPGAATLSLFTFFVEVPTDWQVEFIEHHHLSISAVMAIADKFVRPQIVGGRLPTDSAE